MYRRVIKDDPAQIGLIEHLAITEEALRAELRLLDPNANCELVPAADLGIPYDAIRLGGGFATGCFIQWQCRVPVVPVDITMNIDTSSIFWIDDRAEELFTEVNLARARNVIESMTDYKWNFDASNHFLSLARDDRTGKLAVIIHSNEKEFKNQYHGLCPTAGNWFDHDIRVSRDGRIRLIVGRPAQVFTDMAHMLEPYNITRHRFVMHELLHGGAEVTAELHTHHYFMPTSNSAALGCYVVPPGSLVPVFSQPGEPIVMYEVHAGGPNSVQIAGEPRCIVPHGWGMTLKEPLQLSVRRTELEFQGRVYPREPGVSLLNDQSVVRREFNSVKSFLDAISEACPGQAVGTFSQLRSLTRYGFSQHTARERL